MRRESIVLTLTVLMLATGGIEGRVSAEEKEEREESSLKKTEGLATEVLEAPAKTGEVAAEVVTEVIKMPLKLVEGILGFALKPIVVTPWGTEEYSFDVSKNVSVITKDEIENSNAATLPELLGYKNGVVVSQLLGNPKGATVDIRGFGEASLSNVLVLIDGRRTNQIDLSGVDWAQIDLNTIERIEIVRGASSVLYGDNATGGVINIITKRGETAKPAVKAGGSLGSYGRHAEFGTFQGYHNLADYFFSYSHKDEDGYRKNNSFKANDWFGRLTWHPVEYFDFGISTGYHKDKYGQPGALREWELAALGRRGTVYPDDIARTEDIFITGEPKIYFRFPQQTLTASVHGTYRYRKSYALNIATQAWHGQTDHRIHSGDIRPKLEINSNLLDGQIDNSLVLGTSHFIAADNLISGNILAGRDDVDITKKTLALYAHDNAEFLNRFLLNGGYRYEWVDYKFEQKGQLTNNDRKELNEWAYELGGGYKYNPSSQVYINYSRSYRYPATEEYYQSMTMFWGMLFGGLNRQIKQQIGHNLEIGIKDNSLKWLTVNADYFWIATKREIYFDPATYTNTNYTPRISRSGFDIETSVNLMEGRLVPYVNYTWQKAKFDGGIYDDNDIPLVPANKFSSGLKVTPITDLTWNTALNYTGSRFFVSDQRNRVFKLSSYATVDTKLSYKWKALTVYGGINNAFDKKHYEYGVTNAAGTAVVYYPASGRTFEIGGTIEF